MGCIQGNYDSTLSFSGIELEKKSDEEVTTTTYWNFFHVENSSGSLKVYNTISDGTEKKEYDFLVGQ